MFRNFIALLKFSFDPPSYVYIYICVCIHGTCTLNTCQSCERSHNIHAQSTAFSIRRLLFLEQTKRQFLLLAIDGVFSHTSNTFHRCSLSLQAAISTPREGLPCLCIKKRRYCCKLQRTYNYPNVVNLETKIFFSTHTGLRRSRVGRGVRPLAHGCLL